jgi:uncharacterized membrane protein
MILLPIALTLAIISFLVDFFTAPFVGIVLTFLKTLPIADRSFLFLTPEQTIQLLAKVLILISLFFLIIGLGILTRWYLIHAFLHLWEKVVHKIPIVGTIYKSTKELIKTFFTSQTASFKQVVMVPFPRSGIYALGFLAGEPPDANSPLISVLVPTTPNPTSGFLLMYKKEEVIYLKMKPEAALKYILSLGLLPPPEHPS